MSRIRPARMADADALGGLHVAAWRVAYGAIVPRPYLQRLDPATKAAGWRSRAADPKPGRQVLVHESADGGVDGVVHFGPSGSGGEIHALYVHPARQRHGVGSALLGAAELWLAGSGRERLELWTFAENAAGLAFFAARGWEPDGGTGTWLLGDRRCAEIRLVKVRACAGASQERVLTLNQ